MEKKIIIFIMSNSKYDLLTLIKPDLDILLKEKRDKILTTIVQEVQKYTTKNYFTGKQDVRLIRFVCLLIENLVKKKHKLDKLELFRDVFISIFPDITNDDLTYNCQIVEDLLTNRQIKKYPVLKYALHLAYEFIKDNTKSFFLQEQKN